MVVVQSQITYFGGLREGEGAMVGEEGFWLDVVTEGEGGEGGTRRLAEGALVGSRDNVKRAN